MKRFSYRAKVCGRYFFQLIFVLLFLSFLFPLSTVAAPTLGDLTTKTTLGNDIIGGSKFIYSLGGLSVGTASTSADSLLVAGKVGIGTTTPVTLLDVFGSNAIGRFNSSGWSSLQLGSQANIAGAKNYQITARNDAFYIARSTDDWSSTGSYLLHINSNGNVALGGTTNAQSVLDVNGLIKMRTGLITQPEDVVNKSYLDSTVPGWFVSSTPGVMPPGTSGQTLRHNGAGWIANSLLYNNGTNVGIGTTTPQNPLHLYGDTNNLFDFLVQNRDSSNGNAAQARIRLVAGNYSNDNGVVFGITGAGTTWGGNAYFWNNQNSAFMFATNGTERMRLSKTGGLSVGNSTYNGVDPGAGNVIIQGSVGIGTTTPGAKLDIESTSAAFEAINLGSAAQTQYTNMVWYAEGGNTQLFRTGSGYSSWGGVNSFNIYNSSGPIAFHPGNIGNVLYLSSAGGVGIGTTNTSAAKLVALGAAGQFVANFQGSGGAAIKVTESTGDIQLGLVSGGNKGYLGMFSNHDLAIRTNNTERITILSTGKVGIATTTPGSPLTVSPTSGISADMGTGRIQNVGTPVNTGDAVNKGYVESTLFSMPPEDNLLTNGDFETGDIKGWTKWGGLVFEVITGGYAGRYTAQITGDTNILSSDFIPVDPTKDVFQLEAYVKKSVQGSTPGILYFGYVAYNENYGAITTAPCGSYCYFAASGWTIPNDGNWHKVSATTYGEGTSYPNFPVGTKFVKVLGLINYVGSSNTVTLLDHVRLKRINYGPLFVGNNFSGTNWVDQHQVSKIYTNNANNLILEPPTNGNAGIGTTGPVGKLHVFDSTGASTVVLKVDGIANPGIYLANNGAYKLSIGIPTANGNYISGSSINDVTFRQEGGQKILFSTAANGATNDLTLSGGKVGIGTVDPQTKLQVNGTTRITRSDSTGTYIDIKDYGAGSLQISLNSGNLGLNTGASSAVVIQGGGEKTIIGSTDVPASRLSVSGGVSIGSTYDTTAAPSNGMIIEGNVGIGTTAPGQKLVVDGTVQINTNLNVAGPTDSTRYINLRYNGFSWPDYASYFAQTGANDIAGTRGLIINTNVGQAVGNYGISFAIASSSKLFIQHTGNVGIGTTTPQSALDVNGLIKMRSATITQPEDVVNKSYIDSIVGFSTSSALYVLKTGDLMTGPLEIKNAVLTMTSSSINMNGSDINAVHKIAVAAIDPLYSIGGVKYSTYAGSFVGGVKEEFVGKVRLVRKEGSLYEYVIDFNTVENGSDLWIWYKTIEFSRDNIEVLATAYKVPVSIAYEIKKNKIIFSAECESKKCTNEIEISYRLIGKRFDWRNWPTYAKDQNEKPNLIIE